MLVEGEVETQDTAGVVRGAIERFPPSLYLRETALTTLDPAIADFAATCCGRPAAGYARPARLLDRLHGEIVLRHRPTHAATTAAEAFALKRGVCQDLTHIFIAAARASASPRAISAAISTAPTASTEQEAGHAWAEAFVPASAGSPSIPRTAFARPMPMCGSRSGSIISAPRRFAAAAMAAEARRSKSRSSVNQAVRQSQS